MARLCLEKVLKRRNVSKREFARRLKTFSTLSKWQYTIPKNSDMTDEQQNIQSEKILHKVVASKALIVMTDEQVDRFGPKLGAVRL